MTNDDALVSIIVPVYGTETYLPACIESLCKQSYSNIQIILVDDQSPDKSPEICDYYAQNDNRINVVHQENKGVSGARNTGMRCATGEYVIFVDSDDELYPDAVELLLNDMLEFGADIVSATQKIVSETGDIISNCADGSKLLFSEDQPMILSLDGDENTISVCAKLFKATFIEDLWFEEGKDINEDGFFLFNCYMKKPLLVQHNLPVYKYTVRKGSNSRQVFSDKYLSMIYYCEQKKIIVNSYYSQYVDKLYNMEVRTCLQVLEVLCSSRECKYRKLQAVCIKKVRELYKYHIPVNKHYKRLAKIVKYGLYPIYRILVRLKYYR